MDLQKRSLRIRFLLCLQKFLLLQAHAPVKLTASERLFCLQYQDILNACQQFEEDCHIIADALAARYMNHVVNRRHDDAWWTANAEYTSQPWFIWTYACEHGLVHPVKAKEPASRMHVLMPEMPPKNEPLILQISRDTLRGQEGTLSFLCTPCENLDPWMRRMRFKRISGGYIRKIDECSAPVAERAVEAAVEALNAGYPVGIEERAIYQRILDGHYLPEHRYWVCATEHPEWLRLSYPYDAILHRHLLRMGGRWTGRQMRLPVSAYERLGDIISLYGFRVTCEAQPIIDAWLQAVRQATVYRVRKVQNQPLPEPVDHFRELLKQSAEVPGDLIDEDA